MSTLLLMQYNNYFNRTILKEDTVEDYVNAAGTTYQYFNNINFNPNDDVSTEQIVNWPNNWTPDYCLVIDNQNFTRWFVIEAVRTRGKQYKLTLQRDVIADYNEEIKDSVAFIEKGYIKDTTDPMIHNKEGMILNQIKKQETLLTDKSECPWLVAYLAKEKLGTNITGQVKYIPADDADVLKINSTLANWKFYKYINVPMTFSDDFKYSYWWKTASRNANHIASIEYGSALPYKGGIVSSFRSNLVFQPTEILPGKLKTVTTDKIANYMTTLGLEEYTKSSQLLFDMSSAEDYAELLSYNGKKIMDSTGAVYQVSLVDTLDKKGTKQFASVNSNIYNTMYLAWSSLGGLATSVVPNEYAFEIEARNIHTISVRLAEITSLEATYNLGYAEATTIDSPLFDAICIPYPNPGQEYRTYITIDYAPTPFTVNRDWSMAIMQAITRDAGGENGYAYDLQLLPYCPIQECLLRSPKGYFQTDKNTSVIPITVNSNMVAAAFVVPKSTFSVNINKQIELPIKYTEETRLAPVAISDSQFIRTETLTQDFVMDIPEKYGEFQSITRWQWVNTAEATISSITSVGWSPTTRKLTYRVTFANVTEGATVNVTAICNTTRPVSTATYNNPVIDVKVSNECDFYRLNSPNYNGQFEFNLVSNGNSVSGFHADCTYKPFTPYIQVHPYFKDLYGQDFEDARGLICGGDFSLGMLKDAYQVYEIQNKNYQNIFDRQIQNMDVNNKIARQEAIVQASVGTLQGGATGAATGAMVGGGIGAIAGAAVGTVASGVGGIADYANLTKRQEEAKSYAIDNFNMNIQNIQALPLSITRTSAITANNKLFPFLEYFSCTDEEKDAFVSKLEYDGMRIGKIDTIRNYVEDGQWFKGKLIRNETIKEDTHLFNTIYEELNKGVYM